jgi:hypothetical protein
MEYVVYIVLKNFYMQCCYALRCFMLFWSLQRMGLCTVDVRVLLYGFQRSDIFLMKNKFF